MTYLLTLIAGMLLSPAVIVAGVVWLNRRDQKLTRNGVVSKGAK